MKLETYMLIATISTIVVGVLLGLLRGSRRSVLRLILVLACVIGAYFLKDVVTNALLNITYQGQTIEQFIISQLPQEVKDMGDVIIPVVQVALSVLSFLLCFGILQFLTWAIVFPLCKLFVKKGKKKHSLVGGAVGLVQGVAVAFVMCVVLNGLFVNIGNVVAAIPEEDSQPSASASTVYSDASVGDNESGEGDKTGEVQQINLKEFFGSYSESSICKTYSAIGDKAFDLVASVKITDADGNESKITLRGQFDAITSMLKLAQNADKLSNIEFGTDGIVGCAESIKEVFDLLNDINKDLKPESQETLNKVVKSVAENMLPADLPVDITVIDFTKVDFAAEGEIITDLAAYASKTEGITAADAENIVTKVFESDLIIPLLTSTGEIELGFNQEQKEEALKIVERYEADVNYDADKLAKVKAFLGLNDMGTQQPESPVTSDKVRS